MIALPIFPALMSADLPNRCMIVLAEVLVQSYGPAKRREVHLDPITLEDLTGLHRNNVRKAINELASWGILKRSEGRGWRFVKDYEAWKPHGEPLSARLDGGIIAFAKSATERFARRIKVSKNNAIQRDCPDNPTGLPESSSTQSNGIAQTSADAIQRDCPDTIQERAAEEFKPITLDQHTQSECEFSDKDGNPLRLDSGVSNDPSEVKRVANLAESMFPMKGFDHNVSAFKAVYPMAWIERALIEAGTWPKPPFSFKPISNTLLRWKDEGGPPAIQKGQDSPSPSKVPLPCAPPAPAGYADLKVTIAENSPRRRLPS